MGNYIVDFINLERKVIIELDGALHKDDIRKQKDRERTAWFVREGYKVLRFWNYDILKNIDKALIRIEKTVRNHLLPRPSPSREKEK